MFFSILSYQGAVLNNGRNSTRLIDMSTIMYEQHYEFGDIEGGVCWDYRTVKGKVDCITNPDSVIIVHNEPFPDYYEDEDHLHKIKDDDDKQNQYYDSIPEYIQLTNEEAVKIFDKRYHGKTIELENAYKTYRVKSARIEDRLIIEKN